MTSPLQRLQRANLSRPQLGAYLLANILGLLIVTAALQFYIDTRAALSPSSRHDRFIVVTREVSLLGAPAGFSDTDIRALRECSWVLSADGFTANRFPVSASVSFGGRGMSTKLFFEAVPDRYLDVHPDGWNTYDGSDPGEPVPVLIPRDYLALYNFGFAPAQGLPQITEDLLGALPIRITMGQGPGAETREAVIAGFTDRLNTIAVPLAFLRRANSRLAPGADTAPERIVVETDNPDNPAIDRWLAANDMERNAPGGSPQLGRLLAAGASAVAAIGLIICVLAIIILFLSVHLLLYKSRPSLRGLMLLGYPPMHLARRYIRLVTWLNVTVAICTLVILLPLRTLWISQLTEMGMPSGQVVWSFVTVAAVMSAVTLPAALMIRRSMLAVWHGK